MPIEAMIRTTKERVMSLSPLSSRSLYLVHQRRHVLAAVVHVAGDRRHQPGTAASFRVSEVLSTRRLAPLAHIREQEEYHRTQKGPRGRDCRPREEARFPRDV